MKGDRASPFAVQAFSVEGLAAVAEYVRFRPQAVSEIRCVPRLRDEVDMLIARHGAKIPIHDRTPPRDAGESLDRTRARARGHAPGRLDSSTSTSAGTADVGGDVAPVAAKVLLKGLEPDAYARRRAGRDRDLVVALDHITDPRNLGAIVRSAAFFGVDAVVAPERRQVLLTQAAVATAQGGFALTDLVCVVNLGRALAELKDEGYWIIGTAMDGEPLPRLAGEYKKVCLVLGAEDTGLSKGVREACDRLAAISGAGKLDSLNVSVAAGICLAALSGSRGGEAAGKGP